AIRQGAVRRERREQASAIFPSPRVDGESVVSEPGEALALLYPNDPLASITQLRGQTVADSPFVREDQPGPPILSSLFDLVTSGFQRERLSPDGNREPILDLFFPSLPDGRLASPQGGGIDPVAAALEGIGRQHDLSPPAFALEPGPI